MKKLLFKTLFYSIIFIVRGSKKLGYPVYFSLHNVPLEFVKSYGEVEEEATYKCIRIIKNDFTVFVK